MVLLNPGETVVRQEHCRMESRPGLLLLTNQRLLFEGRLTEGFLTQAFRGPRMATLLDAPLHQVSNAHLDRRLLGRPSLRVDLLGKFRTFRVSDAGAWFTAIAAAKQQADHPSSWTGQPSPVVLQVQAPPPPPPPPPAVVRVRCPYCRTVYDEAAGKCPSCGSPFY